VDMIGRYHIDGPLGEGAMADVYRGFDPEIGRAIAIKILKPELRGNAEIVARFLREARAAGALSHAHVVTIHDVGEADGIPYIAMEYLDGMPLDRRIELHGALPLAQALALGAQLARALDYAHGAGIVHRDIKPSNIILTDNGRTAKLLDFGIARVGEPDPVRAELNALRTQIGQVLGTPRYMSPEQALGLTVDRRSDLFSLGAVLFEMLSGRAAFDGRSVATLAIQITREKAPPLSASLPDCPKGLQHLLDRLLAKDPARRLDSGATLAEGLERELAALEAAPRGRGLPLRWRLSLTMGAVMGAALFLAIWVVLDRQERAIEQMALTSGTTVTRFVANNVGLRAAENAGLPEAGQDWAPVQAFVDVAARDPAVRRIVVTDASGRIRGSSDPALVGRREATPDAPMISGDAGEQVFADGADYRVRRTILYAGHDFGAVELTMQGTMFAAAAREARTLILLIGLALLALILGICHAAAAALTRPLRRLQAAFQEAALGRTGFRISHRRRDEIGALFDAWNGLADALDNAPAAPDQGPVALEATRIAPAAGLPDPSRRTA